MPNERDGRGRLREIQRARILAAAVRAACEQSGRDVTVAHVVAHAGVSRRTFYEIFAGCDDCLLAAFDECATNVSEEVLAAYGRPGRWREKLRAALTALLAAFDRDPQLGRFLMVETLSAGSRALKHRQQILAEVAIAIDRDATGDSGKLSSPLSAEAVVGAVTSVIHDRLLDWDTQPLVELVNPLMSTAVLPYLGPATARRELQMPVPASASVSGEPPARERAEDRGRPQMRLTYRTVRTLEAVAVEPGSSNRKVAEVAGIADQGQVSKLLARLQKLGLVEKDRTGRGRGEPNAWSLTRTGEEVHDSIVSPVSLA
jgi:AcrR family transcriptional regulator